MQKLVRMTKITRRAALGGWAVRRAGYEEAPSIHFKTFQGYARKTGTEYVSFLKKTSERILG